MSIKRIFDFAHEALQKYPQDEMFITKYDGKWEKTSTNEFCHLGNQISRGLLKLGIKPGDKIALSASLTKKVRRYFIDEKIPTAQRMQAIVVLDASKNIMSLLPFVNSYLSIDAKTDKIRYILVYRYIE